MTIDIASERPVSVEGLDDRIHITAISPRETARLIGHPVETGHQTFDDKVIEPVRAEVACWVTWDDRAVLSDIRAMLLNRTYRFYKICARDRDYERMALVGSSHSETPDKFDVFEFFAVEDCGSSSQSCFHNTARCAEDDAWA